MIRSIDWKGAFWVASGVPALVLFSIGGISSMVGNLAFLVWAVSICMGFIQSFTYAEIAGLFPNKSGGASVYGAAAWVRYSKFIAPLSVWCNWLAWTPVLSLGCSIAASYILNAIGSKELNDWTLLSHKLGPVSFSLNATFFIGVVIMLVVFSIQHRGILGTASVQKYVGLLVIVPMAIVGVIPLFNGHVHYATAFSPLVPLASAGSPALGSWNIPGWTTVLGAMFIAAWSAYGFETAVCYTSEFRNPGTDTFKAIFYSGLLCIALYILVPFTFQGALGLAGMLDPSIAAGSGVAKAMADMVGGGAIVNAVMQMLMILALILSIMTAMAGSSRTLYQGSVDGWLPRYLTWVNNHGAPTRAMWTDLIFNIMLLAVASADATSFFFILAISNVGYIIFNFLNLNAGWIHRVDSGATKRPYKAPTWLLGLGALFAFVNAMFMGAGAKTWNPLALWAGLGCAALIIPVFCFRHYIQDKGEFPAQMLEDLHVGGSGDTTTKRAGIWPYAALVAGIGVVLVSNWFFHL
ncbi:APC family permease [Acidocella sp.]|uniref:APC family permease n=1 Tax=Acidocella sp. TaxID=50710 RepID=UPI003CFF2DAE